ncbi:hypothetical protein J2N86_15475 (plasmid) [Legionella lytica]|uniref:Leucine-rich repeat-containing protein (Substrate of the Dot/Icm secretion system) n=1 Tax=Legionella lytica TaxID=96232 RepID=A0ABY4YE46_9GAMM|nr:hypothetical protein [Legionella lytica]USQ15359.1 hypothetical protein J2N86_15475 [Legionella lytica]
MTYYIKSAKQSKLVHNVQNTPLGYTKLNFSSALKNKSVSQIIEIFQAIPDYIVALDLSFLQFGTRNAAEVRGILKAIPGWVSSVKLSYNDLNLLKTDELIHALSGLHTNITRIHLDGNNLGHKSATALSAILTTLANRDKLHALDLRDNKLYLRKTDFELIFISETNQGQGNLGNISELNLSDNRLDIIPTDKLIQAIALLSDHLKCLNLGGNYLHEKSTNDRFIEIFQSISVNVTTLNLERNGLSRIETTLLIALMKNIPKHLTSLSLYADNFYNNLQQETLNEYFGLAPGFDTKNDNELEKILAAIPETVEMLDFSGMLLAGRGIDSLIRFMHSLPKGVTTLNFSSNNLHLIKARHLSRLFEAIPSHITSINLSNNGLGEMDTSTLKKAFAIFPKNVTSISLGDNKFYKKKHSEVIEILSAIPIHVKNINVEKNKLFKKIQATDNFFNTLQNHVKEPERFNWRDNGESNFSRALAPMISFATKGRKNKAAEPLPADNVATILSFLAPASVKSNCIKQLIIEKEEKNKLSSSTNTAGNNSLPTNIFQFFKKFIPKRTVESNDTTANCII